jgi:hypothetical protein
LQLWVLFRPGDDDGQLFVCELHGSRYHGSRREPLSRLEASPCRSSSKQRLGHPVFRLPKGNLLIASWRPKVQLLTSPRSVVYLMNRLRKLGFIDYTGTTLSEFTAPRCFNTGAKSSDARGRFTLPWR